MKKILLFFVCVLLTIGSYAQTVIKLKDGSTVEGEIVEKTDKYIKILIAGINIPLSYRMTDIKNIKLNETNTPKKPTVISGTVKMSNFKGGKILLFAFDRLKKPRKKYAAAGMNNPGPFTMEIPGNIKYIWLVGWSDTNRNLNVDENETELVPQSIGDFSRPINVKEAEKNGIIIVPYLLDPLI